MSNIAEAKTQCERLIKEIESVYVGHRTVLQKLLATALANGHVLFEDNPGLGKTLLVKTLAKLIDCQYTRIQFTPDLMPADVLGTQVWQQKESNFELIKGPIFTNILLADEINRTPPKTQAALLEAMEERQVTIEGETYLLDAPFCVLGTQNPIELEGTYPLPEAQMDRFLLKLSTGYAESLEEESIILSRRIEWKRDDPTKDLKPIISADKFRSLQELVESRIYVAPCILDYISQLVRNTRKHPQVEVGSSPRGGLALLKLARAVALLNGRDFVTPDDVKMFAVDALGHRVILKLEDSLQGVRGSNVIEEIVSKIPAPKDFHQAPKDTSSKHWGQDRN